MFSSSISYLYRVGPNTPVEESVGTMVGWVQMGNGRFLGLTEATPDDPTGCFYCYLQPLFLASQ
ncbi:aldo/keto reductase [Paenibacillus sp. FSL H8-237]|nr:aldo/keto reductase [Paenibacillus sp. FSL H8-237]